MLLIIIIFKFLTSVLKLFVIETYKYIVCTCSTKKNDVGAVMLDLVNKGVCRPGLKMRWNINTCSIFIFCL